MERNFKKFVINVYDDNIEFVDNLSSKEKNDIINQLLAEYQIKNTKSKKLNKIKNEVISYTLIFLALVIGIPLLIKLTAISIKLTKSSYTEMQKNFEKLF